MEPLLVSDLPAFLRWRGELAFGSPELEQLVGVVDRLIVDGTEWRDPGLDVPLAADAVRAGRRLRHRLGRLLQWRQAIARLWPDVAEAERLIVAGPRAEGLLLAGWLRSRLEREVELEHEAAEEIERVELDGRAIAPARADDHSPSDLLSAELEQFGRDRIYEAAVQAALTG